MKYELKRIDPLRAANISATVMGWISGILGAAIYNFVIRWSGGLLLEFAGPDPSA